MGDGVTSPLSIDDFIPIVGKNYIAPHLVSIPASVYADFKYSRPVYLIPKTSITAGICYIYPGAYPANDLASIALPAGSLIYLDARGEWYVKTSSAVTEKFLVIDAGAAANAQAVASILGGAASPSTNALARTMAAGATVTVSTSSASVVAADSTRKYLYIKNVSTGAQRVTIEFAGAAVLDSGHTLAQGEWRAWDISTGLSQQAVTAIGNAASTVLEYVTGT